MCGLLSCAVSCKNAALVMCRLLSCAASCKNAALTVYLSVKSVGTSVADL